MPSFGAADLLILLVFVVLVLDSRRLHALARSGGRGRDITGGIPSGADSDRAGLTLRHIQMRHHVDWQDGGIGWDGPEILPADEPYEDLVDGYGDALVDHDDIALDGDSDSDSDSDGETDARPERESSPAPLPVLWKPLAALPPAGATGRWLQPSSTTSSPTEMRPPLTTAA